MRIENNELVNARDKEIKIGYKRMSDHMKGIDKNKLIEIGGIYGHELVKELPSKRPHRKIFIFKR